MWFWLFKFFKKDSLNDSKCPFCGAELDLSDAKFEEGRVIREAYEENVLCINSRGELRVKNTKHDEVRDIISHYTMVCPKHKYKILCTRTRREEPGKGDDSDSTYEVSRCDYEFISAGNLNEKQVKKLKRCCKNASKDFLRRYQY